MIGLSGDWNSYYRYPSAGRGDDFWGQHLLHATQTGNKLTLETAPDNPSHVLIELEIHDDERSAKGTWVEDTDPNGYYKERRYEGTMELRLAEDGSRMKGVWYGAGRDGTMNSDIWELVRAQQPTDTTKLPKRWKLIHWYPSNQHEGEDFDEHEMKAHWSGDTLVLESLPKEDGSYILARLLVRDNIAAGNWYESAALTGEYKGAQYSGAGQLIVDPSDYSMKGLWAGAGYNHELKKMDVYTGRWEIMPIR